MLMHMDIGLLRVLVKKTPRFWNRFIDPRILDLWMALNWHPGSGIHMFSLFALQAITTPLEAKVHAKAADADVPSNGAVIAPSNAATLTQIRRKYEELWCEAEQTCSVAPHAMQKPRTWKRDRSLRLCRITTSSSASGEDHPSAQILLPGAYGFRIELRRITLVICHGALVECGCSKGHQRGKNAINL